jgi:hypothetical protein
MGGARRLACRAVATVASIAIHARKRCEDVIRSAQGDYPGRIMRIDPCDKLLQCCYGLAGVCHAGANERS